jgi:hypothetical protein
MVQIGKMNRLSIKGIQAYGLQEGEEVDLLVYAKTDFRLTPGQACSSWTTVNSSDTPSRQRFFGRR